MKIIGLTGTIGSGKSTVAQCLKQLGAEVIDADKVGHEIYLPGTKGIKKIVKVFGKDILSGDGSIDRARLADIVFSDEDALKKLDDIVHPLIRERIYELVKEYREKRTGVVVIEAALLIETGWTGMVHEIWVTTAPKTVIYQRMKDKNGSTQEQVRSRMKYQLPLKEQRKYAKNVINTNVPLPELQAKVAALWKKIK
jgi:dephospho-CoA kinase